MVSFESEGSSDSDTNNTKRKSKNSGASTKMVLNTSLQKNIVHAAGISAKKDFLSKMLEKSNRIKDLATFNVKNIDTPKSSPNKLPLKGILKKSFSKKSDDETSIDSEASDNGAVFTPDFASTQIQEVTPKAQKNKYSDSGTNKNIKKSFKKKIEMVRQPENIAPSPEPDNSSDAEGNSKGDLYLQNLFSKKNCEDESRHSKSTSKLKTHNKNASKNKLIDIEFDSSEASGREVKKRKSKLLSSLKLSHLKNVDSDSNMENNSNIKIKNKNLLKNKRAKTIESSDSETSSESSREKAKSQSKARTQAEKLLLQFETERDDLKTINAADLDYEFPSRSYDYELYIGKIPKDLHSYLSGAKLSLTTTTKIETDEGKLICVPSEVTKGKDQLSFFSQENGKLNIITIRVSGKLIGYQELETLPEMEISENKHHVALPNNLKQRHPLFGPNYTDKIELNEEIKHKLETSSLPLKRKKNKRKVVEKKDQSSEHNELIFQMLGKSQEQMSDTLHKSSKKSKKNSTENMDIFEYLNKNVFNSERDKVKKKSKEKLVENSLNSNYFDTANYEEKERKNKRKRVNENENFTEFDSSNVRDQKRMKMALSSDKESVDGTASFNEKHRKNRNS